MTSLYNNVIIYIKGWEKEWVKQIRKNILSQMKDFDKK